MPLATWVVSKVSVTFADGTQGWPKRKAFVPSAGAGAVGTQWPPLLFMGTERTSLPSTE